MTIDALAVQIRDELEDSELTEGMIVFWLRANLGTLNNLIDTSYTLDSNGDIQPELSLNETAIFRLLYLIKYYDKKIRENLGASGVQTLLEVSSDGGIVRRTSRTQVSLEWRKLREATSQDLAKQVEDYHSNQVRPLSVEGLDTISPCGHDYNTINRLNTNSRNLGL